MTTTVETAERGRATGRTAEASQDRVKAAVCQHIAIAVQDPGATAAFYHEIFGLPEVRRINESYAEGIVLTDGFVELGFYKFTESYLRLHDEVPGRSYQQGFTGFHHLGFSTRDAQRIEEDLEVQGRHHGGDLNHTGDPALNPQGM